MTAVETPAMATAAWHERVDSHLEQLSTHAERQDTHLVGVETTLPHLATKADVSNAINALTWRLAAIVTAGLAALAAFLKLTGG